MKRFKKICVCICLWACAWTLQVFPARTRRGHWVPCSGIKGGVGCQMCLEPNPGPLKNNTGFPLLSYLWSCRQCLCFRDGWLMYHRTKWSFECALKYFSKGNGGLCTLNTLDQSNGSSYVSKFFFKKKLFRKVFSCYRAQAGFFLQVPRPWDNRQASMHLICKCSLSCFCDFSDNQETILSYPNYLLPQVAPTACLFLPREDHSLSTSSSDV